MSEPRIVTITPEYATMLLTKHRHPAQRRTKKPSVTAYARRMADGEWHAAAMTPIMLTGSLDVPGVVLNGYHRLEAVVKSGQPQQMLVLEDVPESWLPMVDNTAPRSLTDHIGYHRGKPNPLDKEVSSLVPVVMLTEPSGRPVWDKAVDVQDCLAFLDAHEHRLYEVAGVAHNVVKAASLLRRPVVTGRVLGWLLWQTWDDPDAVQFWRDYGAQGLFAPRDPRLLMATAAQRVKNGAEHFPAGGSGRDITDKRARWMSQAWNCHITGKRWTQPADSKEAEWPVPIVRTGSPEAKSA